MTKTEMQALVIRALKTFMQAFLGTLAAGLAITSTQVALRALLVGAFSAGLSALMNLFIKPTEAK